MNPCPSGWTDPEEIAADELPAGATVEPWTDEDTAELAAAMRDADHDRRDRWSEAVHGGRWSLFFATDPKYRDLPATARDDMARDMARAPKTWRYPR